MIPIKGKTALLVIDMQNDFCEGGSFPVKGAVSIVPIINSLKASPKIDCTIFSLDWHPPKHCSFVTAHPGHKLMDAVTIPETKETQVLWPEHCVAGTKGSAFYPTLKVDENDLTVKKGTIIYNDSYSAFGNAIEDTNLRQLLHLLGVGTVFIVGVAYDYCVRRTAEDARKLGLLTYVVEDASKPVAAASKESADKSLELLGIQRIKSSQILSK